jgi:PEP-CTERM motif
MALHLTSGEINMIPLNRSIFRPLRGVAARCLLAAVPLAIAPAAHAGYKLTIITDPTGTGFINTLGINDSGTVAGFDNAVTNQGFTLTLPSSFTTVNFPGAASTMVTGINATGDLSGIWVDGSGVNHGFTDIGGTFTTVDNPASTVFNQALGINNSDETVGYYAPTISGSPGDVSYSQKGGVFTAITGLPTNFNNQAVGINSDPTPWIVGFYQPDAALATSYGYLDAGGTITTIDPFGSTFTQALGVNNSGEIVGFYVDPTTGLQDGYIDNGGVFTSFDPYGSVSTTINGVNNLGDIVGFYTTASDTVVGFVGTPVPEPSTWAMLLAGFAGLGFLGYRKTLKATAAA